MTDTELDEYTLNLANSTLKRSFDAEAYICKYIAETRLKSHDLVENSDVDEQIDNINLLFAQYMTSQSDEDWDILLRHIQQMLSELCRTTANDVQKTRFCEFIVNLQCIC